MSSIDYYTAWIEYLSDFRREMFTAKSPTKQNTVLPWLERCCSPAKL